MCLYTLSIRVLLALLVAMPVSSCGFLCASVSCLLLLQALLLPRGVAGSVMCCHSLHPPCSDRAVNGSRERVT